MPPKRAAGGAPAAAAAKRQGAGLLQLLFVTAGIYGSYLTQGVLQEKLTTRKYGAAGERFHEMVFLNLAQALCCAAWAAAHLTVTRGWDAKAAPALAYWRVGLSNTVGPACGVVALKNIRRAERREARGGAGTRRGAGGRRL